MSRNVFALLCALSLVACTDGTEDGSSTTPGTGTSTGIESDRTLPPGTTTPTPNNDIFRAEARGTEQTDGNGYANNIRYDSTTDTFYVEGLGFDGDQEEGPAFARATPGTLNGFALYESPSTHPDSLTGTPITQLDHRALYGVSNTGRSEFAIVRTGSYTGYGFGGFVYQRNGSVILPTGGQAQYTGRYAALRDFNGAGGLEYATGDMEVSIDFNGFSSTCTGGCAAAVRGYVRNRRYFDTNGTDITGTYLSNLGSENGVTYSEVPTLVFRVGPDVMDDNGEITGELSSSIATDSGTRAHEEGSYYAVISGDNAEEIVGVLVVESDYPVSGDVTVRETGGFILER